MDFGTLDVRPAARVEDTLPNETLGKTKSYTRQTLGAVAFAGCLMAAMPSTAATPVFGWSPEIIEEVIPLPDNDPRLEKLFHVGGRNDGIDWGQAFAEAGIGTGLVVIWNLVGMEALCFSGVVLACPCVGPQC